MSRADHVNLAYLPRSRRHVQVGRAKTFTAAHKVHERLQWYRVWDSGEQHFIDGEEVSFYRVRQIDHEFGDVPVFPLRAIRKTNRTKENRVTTKTPGGIVRPKTGGHKSFAQARSVAKGLNITNGRGYRALRAQDGRAAVIFRPAVASNRQRKVRAI